MIIRPSVGAAAIGADAMDKHGAEKRDVRPFWNSALKYECTAHYRYQIETALMRARAARAIARTQTDTRYTVPRTGHEGSGANLRVVQRSDRSDAPMAPTLRSFDR